MITVPQHLHSLTPYSPGASPEDILRQYGLLNVVKLASNENPLGSSPLGAKAASAALSRMHRYNDGGLALRRRIATHHGVPIEHISVHNGSDSIIHQVMRTFLLAGETALSSSGGFVSFGLSVIAAGRVPTYAPLSSDYRFDVVALVDAITPSTKVIYIANPNNPTGTFVPMEELEWFLGKVPKTTLVVIDEAYHEYGRSIAPETYPDSTLMDCDNVITLRTFSKAYGLASLRVGYAIGHPEVIQWLVRTKLPFDPNGIACAAAAAALDDTDFVLQTVAQNTTALSMYYEVLNECNYSTAASIANFVMVDCGEVHLAQEFFHEMLRRGFIIRPLTSFGLPHCVRISTGLHDQTIQVVEALRSMAQTFIPH